MSNTFGELFKLTTFGESHGEAVGAVIDGCPADLEITRDFIQKELDKRKPGQSEFYSSRKEKDRVKILSGIFKQKTIGSPIALLVENRDVDSSNYEKNRIRPGHADYTYHKKYGHFDYRGSGRASGRETVGRVCGGAIANKILEHTPMGVYGHVKKIDEIEANPSLKQIKENTYDNDLRCADSKKLEEMKKQVREVQQKNDSIGGEIEIVVTSPLMGFGEPVFDKIEAKLSHAITSIGAVKGIKFGAGFASSKKLGSKMNDEIRVNKDQAFFEKNDSGGMLGGITTGQKIHFRVPVKPTPSIGKKQQTIDIEEMKEKEIKIEGRHDPCICPRILPVIESMTRLVLVDLGMLADKLPTNQVE
ncbi:chorismate synthase [archaeon SCG-AAA382B04]|nr:chorismate synthase [archaeon SCG-AAA382B04]